MIDAIRRSWRLTLLLLVIASAISVCGLFADPQRIALLMAHPARLGPDGAPPSTTLQGAVWLGWAMIILPWAWLGFLAIALRFSTSTATNDAHPRATARDALPLIGIIALAVVVRSPLLGQSFWYDEIVAFGGYSLHGPWIIVGNYFSQANHILSQLLIWCSATLLGADELSLRVPALLASLLAIVCVWGATIEVASRRAALLAAAAMAVIPVAIHAGTDARGYAIGMAMAALALWAAMRARRTGSPLAWTLASMGIAFGVWAHLVVVCFALGLAVAWIAEAVATRDRPTTARMIAGVAMLSAAAALTLLLYAPVGPDLLARRTQFGAYSDTVPSLWGPETWHALLGLGGAWVWWAALPGILLAALGLAASIRDRGRRSLVLAATLGFPVALLLAVIANSWLYARFLLFVAPGVAILIGFGADRLSARSPRLGWLALSVLAAVGSVLVLTLPPRQPLREALAIASAHVPAKSPVGVIGLIDNPLAYYGLVQQVELVDFGDRGARFRHTPASAKPKAIVVLYPTSLPNEMSEALGKEGYALTESLPGWIDWGAGRVDVWTRR
jgi:hypothetical protein